MIKSYLITLVCVLAAIPSQHSYSDNLNIAVAANFKHTLEALKSEFEKQFSHSVNIISASTGQLVQQISHAAPFDIFLAANTAHPQLLWQQIREKRQLKTDALQVYAMGRLAFFSNRALIPDESLKEILAGNTFSRLSMANSNLAPYGLAAKQTLKCYQLAEKWKNKLITGQNIAQAYQFIHSRSVDAGFVALSQVLNQPKQQVLVVNATCYNPIKQMALRLNNKQASYDFMTFLKHETSQAIIKSYGYDTP